MEIEALELALQEAGWTISNVDTSEFPRIIEAKVLDTTESYFQRLVAVVQLNYQGVLHASIDTARALELYEPGYVVSFGIAGTFNSGEAPIGAVVFATQVLYYEPSKEKSNNTQSRMDPINVGHSLLNPYRNIAPLNITKVYGAVASGEKLFADIAPEDRERMLASSKEDADALTARRPTARERIIATTDKIYAVDMEAAGVGRVVERLYPSAEFLALKGISDLADEEKNLISEEAQTRNRKSAADNAASCLVELMRKAPLRRAFRGMPRPFEAKMEETAMREAKEISDILEPFGIATNYVQLYACLLGRRGPIPAYFHWDQSTPALHWIDFKILTALRALPKAIVSPTPLVTIESDDVHLDQPWHSSVHQLLGVLPRTEREVRSQLEGISRFFNRIGFTHTAEEEIRSELQKLQFTGRPEITLNLMRYMLGQFCHRRMFVFTWKSYRAKWEQLTQSVGTWFTIFEWDTLTLGGHLGKQEPPGQDLLIEPRSYASLNKWLNTSPPVEVVQEFANHFEFHKDLFCPQPNGWPLDPTQQLKALTNCWDKVFFGSS